MSTKFKMKRKAIQSSYNTKRTKCNTETQYHNMIISKLQEHAATASQGKSNNVWITLEVVLGTLPLDLILKKNLTTQQASLSHTPTITRVYEEKFMRECFLPEDKPCIMQEACECNFIDPHQAFVGCVFMAPDLNLPNTGMCVLCLRKTTQMLFYRIVAGGLQSPNLLQVYGNICGVEGEYHESVMLTVPPHGPVHCMPLPVVAHQRNRYEVYTKDGNKHLKQLNVAYEDFR